MPTTQREFNALSNALINTKIEDLKKILQNFDLTATNDDGWNCLMFCARFSSSAEGMNVVLKKIEETGGPDLFKRLAAATNNHGRNCFMLCADSSSPEVVKVVLEKIEETGGPDLFKSLAVATDNYGYNCLMHCCCNFESPEVVKVVLEKIEETGGPDSLKSQLTATDDHGLNCLMICCSFSDSPEVMKLLVVVLFHFDVFNEQYSKLDDCCKNELKEKAGIDSASWTPDAASLAEVKDILRGGDSTVGKTKAEGEPVAQKQQQKEQDFAGSSDAAPPALCFKRGIPPKDFEDSTNSLMSIKEAPPNRPDLQDWLPDKQDASSLLHYLKCSLPELKDRPAIKKLIAENGLTDNDIKILHSYKIRNPFPVYLWLNGWLGGDRRDGFVKENVAPFFTLLYRAMEKLPLVKRPAIRAIKVNGIASLQNTFDNYKTACDRKKILSFWGFSSFSTEPDVVNREEFVGKPDEQAIVYSCSELEGVDMEPFTPKGWKSECEILPLCPCVLEVASAMKFGQKLFVNVKQLDHANFSYVARSTP